MPRKLGQWNVGRRQGLRILASASMCLAAALVGVGIVAASERTDRTPQQRTVAVGRGTADSEHLQLPSAQPRQAQAHTPRAPSRAQHVHRSCRGAKGGASRLNAVPILMHHAIEVAPAGAPYSDLYVPHKSFAKQMRYLAEHGYHAVTLQQVWDHWRGCKLPRAPIVLSFDDGFRDWFTAAYPILAKHGWVGTMNLTLSHIGEHGKNTVWVRKLIAAGWELDSHTLTHPNLTLLGNAGLRHEIAGSRRELQRLFDVPVRSFAYPSGAFDPRVIAAVRAAGYLGAVSTIDGLAVRSERFALRRVRIDGSDDLHDFARKLNTS